MKEEFYCPNCNGNRWKTKIKGKEYQCRKCGFIGIGSKSNIRVRIIETDNRPLKWWQKLLRFIIKLLRK